MKSIRILAVVVLVAMALTMAVSAADFTASAENSAATQLVEQRDAKGRNYNALILNGEGVATGGIPRMYISILGLKTVNTSSAIAETTAGQSLLTAYDEIKDSEIIDLYPEFAAIWEEVTEGAPVENAVVCDIFEITIDDSLKGKIELLGEKIQLLLTGVNVGRNDTFVVLHKGENGYEVVEHEWTKKGLAIYTKSCSPFIIVKDNGAAPEIPTTVDEQPIESPKTGVNAVNAVVCAALCAAVAAACVVKAKKEF